MAHETFAVERDGAVTTVWFNRPQILNPINATVMRELLAITAELDQDEDTRVVILTGRGTAFSAGADTKALLGAMADREARRALSDTAKLRSARTGRRLMDDWERLDQVTIAAINGWAVGGGLSLAMACDFRLMADGARIFIPEVRLGLPYMWGSISRLISLVGMARAKELVMTCDQIGAPEALAMGLVNRVVPGEQLLAAARALADKLLALPPMAVRRTKEFFRALHANRAGDITFADAYLGAGCADGEDTAEAITAFREKRPGRYQNR
jgi:enoyl-CoA hydratase/carnithine racemase